jgi:hypothetical protein
MCKCVREPETRGTERETRLNTFSFSICTLSFTISSPKFPVSLRQSGLLLATLPTRVFDTILYFLQLHISQNLAHISHYKSNVREGQLRDKPQWKPSRAPSISGMATSITYRKNTPDDLPGVFSCPLITPFLFLTLYSLWWTAFLASSIMVNEERRRQKLISIKLVRLDLASLR